MESRKVQLAGGSTFTVSLPKEWAREHGVDAGSEVAVRPNGDGTLLLQVDRSAGCRRQRRVDVSNQDADALAAVVRALYAAGHDEFELAADGGFEPALVRAVEDAAADLVGLEVSERADGHVRLHSALDLGCVSMEQTLLQLRHTARSTYEDAAAAAVDGDDAAGDRVRAQVDEVARLRSLVERTYRRGVADVEAVDRLGLDRERLADHARTARTLGRVATHADRVAAAVPEGAEPLPDPSGDDLRTYARDAVAVADDAAGVLLDGGDAEAARARLDEGVALARPGADLRRAAVEGDGTATAATALLHRSTMVAEAGADLARAALRAALDDAAGAGTDDRP